MSIKSNFKAKRLLKGFEIIFKTSFICDVFLSISFYVTNLKVSRPNLLSWQWDKSKVLKWSILGKMNSVADPGNNNKWSIKKRLMIYHVEKFELQFYMH